MDIDFFKLLALDQVFFFGAVIGVFLFNWYAIQWGYREYSNKDENAPVFGPEDMLFYMGLAVLCFFAQAWLVVPGGFALYYFGRMKSDGAPIIVHMVALLMVGIIGAKALIPSILFALTAAFFLYKVFPRKPQPQQDPKENEAERVES